MIESIEIMDTATFQGGPHLLRNLKPINFIFGANGTGKTTISRLIAAGQGPKCSLNWTASLPLDRFVYNRDFVEANFSQRDELEGIFTLGEEEINLAAQVEEQRARCDKLRDKIIELSKHRDGDPNNPEFVGKKQELEYLSERLKEDCWLVKTTHDTNFHEVLNGYHRKEKFKARALKEFDENECSKVDSTSVKQRVDVLYGPELDTITELPLPSFARLIDFESSPILEKKVVGKNDVDVATIINEVGSSDWVKQGLDYLDRTTGKCPFCQQEVSAKLKEKLEAYFDKTYIDDMEAISSLKDNYVREVEVVDSQLTEIEQSEGRHLDVEDFQRVCSPLKLLLKGNIDKIQKKQDEPSRSIHFDKINQETDQILKVINAANSLIRADNDLISRREAERSKIEEEVWRLLLDAGLTKLIKDYNEKKSSIEKGIAAITKQISEKHLELEEAQKTLNDLEKRMTSVEPSVNDMNRLLSAFGFRGFYLAMTEDKLSYRLVRRNGELAKNTLSEGEKTFVMFLYFFHLLKGNTDGTSISSSRIVVFDDPVSSLDSDILHIVSSLLRGLFEEVCAGIGIIKQVFVLTHNIAFHKEVTYYRKQHKGISPYQITFWKIFKRDEQSQILFYRTNPVKSSYELLWAEIANRKYNCTTIQNTLRRILEQASKLLGAFDSKKLETKFKGAELTACHTLMAWVNDGSHFCYDDLCVTVDESTISIYLNVFQMIFEECGWGVHYRMMMAMEEELSGKSADGASPSETEKGG